MLMFKVGKKGGFNEFVSIDFGVFVKGEEK